VPYGSIGGGGATGIVQQVEENGGAGVVDTTDSASGIGNFILCPGAGNAMLILPGTAKFFKITAVEWKNGAVVNGNTIAGVCQVDRYTTALGPIGTQVRIIGYTPLTANVGASQIQRANLQGSVILAPGTQLCGFVITDSATHTFRFIVATGGNRQKLAYGTTSPPKPLEESIVWATSGSDFYFKIYFQGYN